MIIDELKAIPFYFVCSAAWEDEHTITYESEDERIRKGIIRNLEYLMNRAEGFVKDELKKRIAWLEKQGQTFTKKDVDYAYLTGVYDAKQELEKQGEKKVSYITTVETGDGGINALVTRDIEIPYGAKDSELQEVSYYIPEGYYAHIDDDKVIIKRRGKSKFNVGDWIISNNKKSTYQVKEVKRGIYVIRDNADNHEYHIGIEEAEKSGRLWTIQDAKDGDVLADKYNNIGIFQECKGICWHSYIYLGCDGELRGFNIGGSHEQTGSHPATKEQREQLEKAMADAGYEWDAEKKELKHDENE